MVPKHNMMAPNIGECGGISPMVLHRRLLFKRSYIARRDCELSVAFFRERQSFFGLNISLVYYDLGKECDKR